MNRFKIVFCTVFIFLFSCNGRIQKTWTVTNFEELHTFKIHGEMENKSYSTAIVYIVGDVTTDICFRSNPNDNNECREFSADTTFIKSRYDFYGGTFRYYLLPSKAKGKIKITIELPYYSKLF